MAVILKDGSVFLHIPKTGGNWVTAVLKECNLIDTHIGEHKHLDMGRTLATLKKRRTFYSRYIQSFGRHKTKAPFMFCFVRHPLSWYESWFKYMSHSNRNWCDWGDKTSMDSWHPNSLLNGLGSQDFNQFVQNINHKRPGYVTELCGWYTTPPINFIGKQETLCEDLINVLKSRELDFNEDLIRNYTRVGTSKKPAREIIWDPIIRDETYKLEYAGIVRYGYHEQIKTYSRLKSINT